MEMKVSEIAKAVELVARDWRHSPYYEKYDNPAGLIGFWGEKSEFRKSFEKLDLTSVIELACGHGRHAAQIVDRCGQLILMDVNAACIEFCRTRIKTHAHVSFHVNSGADFQPVSDESV